MVIRKNSIIEIDKVSHLLKFSPDGNPYHQAQVSGYIIRIGNPQRSESTLEMTLDDLKELRRAIRKVIRNESN